jgi:hypothetical protein
MLHSMARFNDQFARAVNTPWGLRRLEAVAEELYANMRSSDNTSMDRLQPDEIGRELRKYFLETVQLQPMSPAERNAMTAELIRLGQVAQESRGRETVRREAESPGTEAGNLLTIDADDLAVVLREEYERYGITSDAASRLRAALIEHRHSHSLPAEGRPCRSCGATAEVCEIHLQTKGGGCCDACCGWDTHNMSLYDWAEFRKSLKIDNGEA